jgi:hypothetical protein
MAQLTESLTDEELNEILDVGQQVSVPAVAIPGWVYAWVAMAREAERSGS